MAFFGPATLGGSDISQGGKYDQIIQSLMAQFPGLRNLQGQAVGSPQTLGQEGYTFPGNNLYSGQGANIYGGLGLFEGSSAGQPESLTAGLATGALGKSSSQTPVSAAQPQSQQVLSSPSLATFGNQSALGAGVGGFSTFDQGGGGGGGTSVNLADIGQTANSAYNAFNQPSQQTSQLPAGLTQNEMGQYNTFTGAANSPVTVQPGQIFGGIGGGALQGTWEGGGQLMSPETWQNLQNLQPGSLGGITSGGGGGGGGAEGGTGSILGAVGAGLGTAASLNALIQGAQTGNPLAIGGGLAGLYTSGAPLANAAFGTSFPTVSGALTSGLNAIAPSLEAGAGGTVGAIGAEAGAEGFAAAGAGAGLGAASAIAAPIVIAGTDALMHPNETGDLLRAYTFGAFDSRGGGWLNELLGSSPEKSGKVKELEGIVKDYGSQLPVYAEGLQLPNYYAQLPTDPAQRGQALQQLYAKASNILNQGPVMSRAEGMIKNAAGATGIDLSFLNQNSATIAQNALATLIKTGDELSSMGLQPPVNGLAPIEAAQWAGNYSGVGGAGQPLNPAYQPQFAGGWDPMAATTVDPMFGNSAITPEQMAMFTPGNYEQGLNQYVTSLGGNYGGSSLGQLLANFGHPIAGGSNPAALTPDMEAQIAALFKQAA